MMFNSHPSVYCRLCAWHCVQIQALVHALTHRGALTQAKTKTKKSGLQDSNAVHPKVERCQYIIAPLPYGRPHMSALAISQNLNLLSHALAMLHTYALRLLPR
jgi:hypothetical protein